MKFNELLRIVGSLRFAAVILVMLCIAMACATVYEVTHGTPAALSVFYKSWWFELLLGLLGLNVLASMLARYPWSRRHAGFLVTHASILGILGGAWVTEHWGINGQVAIVEGQSAREFTSQQDVLTLRGPDAATAGSVELFGGIGGPEPVTRPATAPLQVGDVRVTVQAYLPNAVWTDQVVDDNPHPRVGLEITLAGDGRESKTWVLADESTGMIAVRAAASDAEFEAALAPPASQPAGTKTVKLEINGTTHEFSLEQCLAGPVAVGETGYSVRVLRYLPHALVENKQLISASDQPVNPAIEAEITGPEGTAKRFAFARFPEFGSMHGTEAPSAGVKLTFIAPVDERPRTPVEVIAGPQGRLVARFQPESGSPVVREVKVGEIVQTPWAGLTFSVARRFDNARRQRIAEPAGTRQENPIPAVSVQLETGASVRQVWLRKYEPMTVELGGRKFELAYENQRLPLGFEIKLNRFHIGTYPGTGQPRTFESHVTLVDAMGNEENRIISMNKPAKFGSYSLFQSSYQQSRSGPSTSVLSVSWDPGLPVVFTSYVTLIVGMIYVLVTRMRGRRRQSSDASTQEKATPTSAPASASPRKNVTATQAVLAVMILLVPAFQNAPVFAADAVAALPKNLDMSVVRAIPVQHDGRWMPLDTVARDTVNAVTGDVFFRGTDPVALLLAWTFNPQAWFDTPLIRIGSAELRRELQLAVDRDRFSFRELVQHQPLRDQIDHLAHRSGGKMNPLETKVSEINRKLHDLQEVFENQVIRPIPDAKSAQAAWQPIPIAPPTTAPAGGVDAVQAAWTDLQRAFFADDASAFSKAAQTLSAELAKLPAAHRLAPAKIATELKYNRLQPYTLAWKLMVVGALLATAALFVRRRWFDFIVVAGLLAGFGALTYGLGLRWQIAGRIPAANMFESLLFLSWGAGAFAIVAIVFLKDRTVPLTASTIGALALFLADTLPIDSFIRPIAPVLLDTVWMSIHVPGIMISYAVLALAALIAHVQMFTMALAPKNRALIDRIDAMHYWYMHVGVILLGAGIITGSMWAAFSWGRYWGWDPKEVWSLIAFLAYLVIMHVRVDRERMPAWSYAVAAVLGAGLFVIILPKLVPIGMLEGLALLAAAIVAVLFITVRGQFANAFKSAVAFWFIIMTYIGVNYVLGIGLHSYGFGTGAVVHYMMLTGSIDLLIVGLLTIIYLARTRSETVAAVPATTH